ncbi:unnamed protein product, partial [marine sediment metagenome]
MKDNKFNFEFNQVEEGISVDRNLAPQKVGFESNFIDQSTQKKFSKKSTTSSSSSATLLCTLEERIFELFGLDLIYDNFRKTIFSDLRLEVEKINNIPNLDSGIKKMRINKLFEPLELLSKSFCNIQDTKKTKDYLEWMFGSPFSIRQVLDNYDFEDRKEFNKERRKIRRLADNLVQAGIFRTDHI